MEETDGREPKGETNRGEEEKEGRGVGCGVCKPKQPRRRRRREGKRIDTGDEGRRDGTAEAAAETDGGNPEGGAGAEEIIGTPGLGAGRGRRKGRKRRRRNRRRRGRGLWTLIGRRNGRP